MEKLRQFLPFRRAETRANPNMLQRAFTVEEAQKKRSDQFAIAFLMPAKSRDNAIAVPLMLYLEHHSFVGFIGAFDRLCNNPIQTRSLKTTEPIGGDLAVACCRS